MFTFLRFTIVSTNTTTTFGAIERCRNFDALKFKPLNFLKTHTRMPTIFYQKMVIFGGFGVRKKLSPYSLLWQASRYAVRPRVVEFRLEKSEGGWWERLLRERARQHWLRWPGLMITLAIIL